MAKKLKTVTRRGTHLDQLKTLAEKLAVQLDEAVDQQGYAQLAKQYRETIGEIAEIEGYENSDDELSEILDSRKADGKPGAVRKNRSDLS
jgi:hypothetical protein